MPTYVYECKKCNHRFEILQSITDPPRKRCPECRSAVRRIFMPGGGLIFRGSGFYITDYKRKENPGGEGRCAERGSKNGERGEGSTAQKSGKNGERGEGSTAQKSGKNQEGGAETS